MKKQVFASCLAVLIAACSQAGRPGTTPSMDAAPPPPPPPPPPADAGAVVADDARAPDPLDAVEVDAGQEPAPDANAVDAAEADAGSAPDASAVGPYGPYANDGVETFTVLEFPLTNAGRSFTEHVYLPDSPVPHPVVLFGPGTQQPATSYPGFFRRLASHGIMVVSNGDPGLLARTPAVVEDMVYVGTNWLPAQNADAASALFGRVDLMHFGLAGHSRGGKATLMAAEGGLHGHVLAYFGVDTIDATFIDDGVYALTNVASVGIPTAFLVASVPGSCSPVNANGEVMYGSAPSPSVMITAIGAAHTQFATPCVACSICSGTGTVDQQIVLDYSIRYLMAFFARELLGDSSVGPAFEGAGAMLDIQAGLIAVQSK